MSNLAPNVTFLGSRPKLTGIAMEKVSIAGNSFPAQSGFAAEDSVIMMVDDEILNIEMTQAFLEDAGYSRFVSTSDSEGAIELMRREKPHVLLLDLSMPKVGGMQILAALREDNELRHIPVLVLTINSDGPTKLQALGLGAIDFLAKPVDPSELALRLRNTLAAAAQRKYLLTHDVLTQLPNRQSYQDDVEASINTAKSRGHGCALLHIGIDKLSHFNNALGRTSGDLLVHRMAKRLKHCVEGAQGGELGPLESQYPCLYRLDGDEFAVLVPFLDEIESAASLITSLLKAAATRLKIGSSELFVTASLGVVVYPIDGVTPAELIRDAGLAMSKAREIGNTYQFFTPDLKERAFRALMVGGDIRRALANNEISVYYLPKVGVSSGQLMGIEAVIRWTQADQTVVEGSDVFRLAGTSDMAVALAEWMLAQISRQTAQWQSQGLGALPLGIKVSLRHISPTQLVELLSIAIIRGAKAKMLCLELSGMAGLKDSSDVGRMTAKLRDWGFRIALDCFGTGEANLSDLNGLSIDEIKMDPSFMAGVESHAQNAAIIRSTLTLARDLRCTYVVQGVQTPQQLLFLKEIKADQCQGRLFSSLLPPTEFATKWLSVTQQP